MIWRANLKTVVVLFILCGTVFCAEDGEICFICSESVDEAGTEVVYRGILHLTHTENCLRAWEQAVRDDQLDAFVFKIEPRGALFQGDSKFLNPTFQKAHPMSNRWMWIGVGLLVTIVSGGVSAALAIVSDRSTLLAFIIGFFMPGIGIPIIKLLPIKRGKFELRGTKIPTTFDAVNCPKCNYPIHPTAKGCMRCGTSLTPISESEISKVKKYYD